MGKLWAHSPTLLIILCLFLSCEAGDTGEGVQIDPTVDADLDGLTNSMEDLNGDGVYDEDSDGDGIPNYLDVDDDEDGTLTALEIAHAGDEGPCSDCDGDGVPDYLESSLSSVPVDWNLSTNLIDADGDGRPNQDDEDDDNDYILTYEEDVNDNGNYFDDDTDGDGTINAYDSDDDGDGIQTADEDLNDNDDWFDDDPNGNGIPAFLDADE